jgi:anthranilate phosphoribosyltransferase
MIATITAMKRRKSPVPAPIAMDIIGTSGDSESFFDGAKS